MQLFFTFRVYSAGALLCPHTIRRQSSRIAAFLQADPRPMSCWPRSASTARSQVWLGLPNDRFQSGGSPRITAATARWWSSSMTVCLGRIRWASSNRPSVYLTLAQLAAKGIVATCDEWMQRRMKSAKQLWTDRNGEYGPPSVIVTGRTKVLR